jgi:hypothetical protein
LRTAVKSEDIEVRTRAEKLVKEIVSSMGADTEEILDDDEIVTKKFTIRGTLLVDKFVIKTKYGTITAEKKDVKNIVVTKLSMIDETIVVSGSSHAGSGSMKNTGIDLGKGDKITIRASGTVHIRSWNITVSPDGNKSYSSHFPGIQAGALMGRIGTNGPLFLIGSNYKGVAGRSGRLYLGIGVRPNYSGTGDFRAKVQVQRK